MNKEYYLYLELLANKIRYKKEYVRNDIYRLYIKKNEIELLEKYLTKLEQIKNSNPSEALKCLERIDKEYATIECEDFDICFNIIKQALIKAQEQEKVLKIIKEKNVDIYVLKVASSVEHYNNTQDLEKLTQEEFDILKGWSR